jgi:hypothetical membrane protein
MGRCRVTANRRGGQREATRIPWWSLVSAAAGPVLLVGGWTLAESRQPPNYDPVRDTISALAAHGATDRWIMTSALAGLGACYLITAAGLTPAGAAGRYVLAVGGVGTVLVAAFPQPAEGNSVAHTVAATVAFVALAAWPACAARRQPCPLLLAPKASALATLGLLGLVGWFALELHGGQRGLAERFAAAGEALWPLAVVVTSRRFLRRRPEDSAGLRHQRR